MELLTLPKPPDACIPISDEDFVRLKAMHGNTLWTDPERCLTCLGKRQFNRRHADGSIHAYKCECEEQWLLYLWMINAGIGLAYQRLGLADTTAINEAAQVKIWDYLSADRLPYNLSLGQGIMLWSPDRGTGKSLMATLALKSVLLAGYSGYMTTFNDMLDLYQSTWRDDDQKRWFDRRVRNTSFLVIDDIGRENRSANVTESMFDSVIRARNAAALPTIITTNLKPEEVQQGYGHNVLSLLSGSLVSVEVKGSDYRKIEIQRAQEDVIAKVSRPVVVL